MAATRAVAARCLNWIDATISCQSSVRLDELISTGTTMRKRLQKGFDFVARWKEKFRGYRAKQLKKRTCSMCGQTAPNSSHAFAYCGGCRHASIPHVDRPRYCSEACQRAHWLAGHMHECPRKE